VDVAASSQILWYPARFWNATKTNGHNQINLNLTAMIAIGSHGRLRQNARRICSPTADGPPKKSQHL
jgi:hypothetical protein